MDKIAELRTIVDHPNFYLQKLKDQSGRKMVGTVCSYAPEELIYAAGALPVRLFGSDMGIHRADLHLQSYCCSLVRGILEEALSDRLNLLEGMVFPHTCDTIQRLSDIWRLNIPQTFHADVVLPVKLNTSGARKYYADVLSKFASELEMKLGKKISDSALADTVRLYNGIRTQLKRLNEMRCANPQVLSGRDYHAIVRASMIMERMDFLEALTAIVSDLAGTAPEPIPSRARLIVTGSVCSQPDIYDAIENAGGVVVGDDLCTGTRYFEGLIDESLPLMDAIVQRYAERVNCPAKHTGLTDRGKHLIRMVGDCQAKGVVFLLLKFCDPHAFDYPYIKEMLDAEKIPSLLLEIEEQTPAGGQLETRLETFIQIL